MVMSGMWGNRGGTGWRAALARRTFGSETGSSLVELGLIAPLLALMVVGVADFGRVLYTANVLSHAARAGAQFGAQQAANTVNTAGIQLAASQEAVNIGTIGVTSSRTCECPSGPVACTTATCTGYGVPQLYVTVTTTATFQTTIAFPGIPSSVALSRTARMRVQ